MLQINVSDSGFPMYPLQILHKKFAFLYLIRSLKGRILCFKNKGLVCSYLFLKEISLTAALTLMSIGSIYEGNVEDQLIKLKLILPDVDRTNLA